MIEEEEKWCCILSLDLTVDDCWWVVGYIFRCVCVARIIFPVVHVSI